METDALLAQLAADGPLTTAAAERAGWDAAVPGLEWDVRAVVVHTGAVHRWAGDIVRRSLPTNETGGSSAFHPDLSDSELPGWFAQGHAELLDTLRAAPGDLAAFTFLRDDPPRRFWIRRQAHETAIHRADAEAAGGEVTPFDAEFAQDGIAELVYGFGRGRAFASVTAATLALVATDGPSWLVTFGGERNRAEQTDDPADATTTVTGTSSALYLWTWNRPAPVEITGSGIGAELWRRVRIQ